METKGVGSFEAANLGEDQLQLTIRKTSGEEKHWPKFRRRMTFTFSNEDPQISESGASTSRDDPLWLTGLARGNCPSKKTFP